ncbi:MAG: Na+/H+ antiporter [Limisphaerales bacterium]
MAEIELVCLLLMIVAALDVLARKLDVPYPVLLVLSGLGLSFVPFLPRVAFRPDLALIIFLPPLLFPAALFTSWRDFRRNLRTIALLAFGLVLITMFAVAAVARLLMPGLPWSSALILGAIVSPPDAVSATAVLQRLQMPQRVVAILEGESLVNDAVALVAYRFGIAAVVTGVFSVSAAAAKLPMVALGGILFGWLVGFGIGALQKRLNDPPVQTTISLLTAFIAYLPAEQLGLSGVLSVVTCGLYLGWNSPIAITPRTRLEAGSFWRMIVYLLNGIIFISIGLELPQVIAGLKTEQSWPVLALYAVSVSATVVVVRIAWVFIAAYIPRLLSKKLRDRDPYPNWRSVVIVAWSGMRGVVSLAAALALPFTTATGQPFPGRNIIVFLSFCVILTTLVFQGSTLSFLIRRLGLDDDHESRREELHARHQANEAGLKFVQDEANAQHAQPEFVDRLVAEYRDRLAQLHYFENSVDEPDTAQLPVREYNRLARGALQAERQKIIELRNQHHINDETLRILQRDLDLAEARIEESE